MEPRRRAADKPYHPRYRFVPAGSGAAACSASLLRITNRWSGRPGRPFGRVNCEEHLYADCVADHHAGTRQELSLLSSRPSWATWTGAGGRGSSTENCGRVPSLARAAAAGGGPPAGAGADREQPTAEVSESPTTNDPSIPRINHSPLAERQAHRPRCGGLRTPESLPVAAVRCSALLCAGLCCRMSSPKLGQKAVAHRDEVCRRSDRCGIRKPIHAPTVLIGRVFD
jgi:hypothetical protein